MLNHIVLMGRLTRDPELRTTQSGVNVASFAIACERDFAQNGEREADFFNCVAWRGTGEFVSKYFSKGSMIVVSGRLQSRKWQDNQGNKRVSWEINADSVYFGESKKNQDAGGNAPTQGGGYYAQHGQYGAQSAPAAAQPQQQQFTELDDDDGELPF